MEKGARSCLGLVFGMGRMQVWRGQDASLPGQDVSHRGQGLSQCGWVHKSSSPVSRSLFQATIGSAM